MSGIRTNAAAELLGVSPNTLRSWERRFGYPRPRRTQGGHRQYDLTELEALRRALLETHNISSAIELARQRGEGPSSPSRLVDAFDHFDEGGADRVMEESLAVRSVERTVEEVLELGRVAGARTVALIHHDPMRTDADASSVRTMSVSIRLRPPMNSAATTNIQPRPSPARSDIT